jgi:hypothetical protein
MQVVRFECPHCSASLKVRDDDLVARPVDCPECRKPIVVRLDAAGKVSARRPAEPTAPGKKTSKTQTTSPNDTRIPAAAATDRSKTAPASSESARDQRTLRQTLSSRPVLASVIIATVAGIGMGVAVFAFWPRSPQTDTVASGEPAPRTETKNSIKHTTDQAPVAKPWALQPPTAASRLAGLGELLIQYRKRQGNFPAGTSGQEPLKPSERLSWLAELAAGSLHPNQPGPLWIEAWDSPRNDRFVRQQIPEFLNPSVEVRVSPRKYPATHFVGVAGVGEDAADLPVNDPRAGIFGNSRTTRLDDIRDGTSNTLMVVGVTNDLGSWAEGGSATVRPFTREPYVNGPDGFGTGSSDRMMVLKADGSVAEMLAATDPRIFRRMAAMADGIPLDPKVPGEPGDRSRRPAEPAGPLTSVRAGGPGDPTSGRPERESPGSARAGLASSENSASASNAIASRSPIVASRPAHQPTARQSAAGQKPQVDIAAGLAQHIVRFEQTKPVPVQDVLSFLEELLAVSIKGDKHDIADLDDLLQTPVTFQLENTTVREILKSVLAKVGLTFEVEGDAIRLRKLESARAGGVH